MVDTVSKLKRSQVMSAVRGRGNRSTEWRLRARLISYRFSGWRIHAVDVFGKPDFVFDNEKVAIFVDGCFWHGCKTCNRRIPETNQEFWEKKISSNIARDGKVIQELERLGWHVIRVWEHELQKDPIHAINIIRRELGLDTPT